MAEWFSPSIRVHFIREQPFEPFEPFEPFNLTFNKNTPYRYERKFTASALHSSEVFHHVKKHPALFREIFHPRQVNNIYFDTPGLKFYTENKLGISERKKVRIRWYGDTSGAVPKPKLEYKIKAGLLGTKWTFPLTPFELGGTFSHADIQQVFAQSDLPPEILEDLKTIRPSLVNSYLRTYFLSADEDFRLTFDEDLRFYRIDSLCQHFLEKRLQEQHFILELKYAEGKDDRANLVSSKLPFRLDKSSKYVSGIDLVRVRRG